MVEPVNRSTVIVLPTNVEAIDDVQYNVGANRNKLPLIVSTVIVEQSIVEKYASLTNAFLNPDKVDPVIVLPTSKLLL